MKAQSVHWEEPNRRNTPPLHIASRGDRFSTLTGAWWIDNYRFVVNHRSGLRVALFDTRFGSTPLAIESIPHLSDDIAAKQIGDTAWEVAVSGCWDSAYSLFRLTTAEQPNFELLLTKEHSDKTFCHGVTYDSEGTLCLAYHTGENPRIEVGNRSWRLPEPWGARDVCFDYTTNRFYAVAVSKNPSLGAYDATSTSVWLHKVETNTWESIARMDNVHSDACQVYKDRIWLPDQLNDRVIGLDLSGKTSPLVIGGRMFDFPHGLSISEAGLLAVTNYGSSNVTICDLAGISSNKQIV